MNRTLQYAFATSIFCLGLGGCVTETTGGMPGPAPAAERLQAQLDLARGYLEQRDFDRARPPLERALSIDPRSVESHVLRAVLYQAENEPELAERHYRTALGIDADNAQALNNFGSFLYARGRYEDAVETLSRLVANPNYRARAQAFENLGLAYLRTGNRIAARSAFERSLGLNVRMARANLELADLAYEDGALAAALEHFGVYNTLTQPNARSLCLGLKLAVATRNSDQVASYGLALKNLFPEQADQCQTKG